MMYVIGLIAFVLVIGIIVAIVKVPAKSNEPCEVEEMDKMEISDMAQLMLDEIQNDDDEINN